MEINKKALTHIMMDFMDDFVEEYFVFNKPLIKKQDNLNDGQGYGNDKRKMINFTLQVDKPSRKDVKSYVDAYLIGLDRLEE